MYYAISLLSALLYFPEVSFIFKSQFDNIWSHFRGPYSDKLLGMVVEIEFSCDRICTAYVNEDRNSWRVKGSKRMLKSYTCASVCILVSPLGLWPKLLPVLHLGTPSLFHFVSIRSSASSAHWLVMSQCCSLWWNKLLQGRPERRRWILVEEGKMAKGQPQTSFVPHFFVFALSAVLKTHSSSAFAVCTAGARSESSTVCSW